MSKSKESTIKIYILAYLKPALWAVFIFFLSSQQSLPGFSISIYDFVFKKLAHMFVYAVLYFLLFQAYQQTNGKTIDQKSYLFPLFISLLYALTDELHQVSVPHRHPALRDVGFDAIGMATVLLYQLKLI